MRRAAWSLLVVAGLAVFGLALALAFVPELGSAVPVDAAVALLGSDYMVVAVLGALAAVALAALLVRRAATSVEQATPPAPEEVQAAPHLGAEFDDWLAGLDLRARLTGDRHERVRERLRETAVHTVMRAEGCSREEARRRVESGEWTDDPTAAAFLGRESRLPLGTRARAALRGDSGFQYGARETVDAIAGRREGPQ